MTTTDEREAAIAYHEAATRWHMELARSYREQLDALERTDPEEYAQFDREDTIGTQVRHARWHHRVACIIRTQPTQARLL